MRNLTELNKLEEYLQANSIPYERIDEDGEFDRHQIIVYDGNGGRKWDAICQRGSYGVEQGLLEIYGDIVDEAKDGDSVVGWLTAEDVITRIE